MKAKHIARTLALAILLSAGVASAQTTDASTTPGVANTGQGGNMAQNMILLGSTAVIAIGGTAYLARKQAN